MTTTVKPYQAGDMNFLKQLNRAAILNAVRHDPGLSRAEIATRAGLTKVTVGTLVQELIEQGWLVEGELQQGGGGRPGRALHLSEDRHVLIGAEVGVQGLRAVACTLTGTIIHQASDPNPPTTAGDTAAQLASLLEGLLNHPKVAGREVLGVGIAVPGPVDPRAALVLTAPNLDWQDVPFLDLLRPHLPTLHGHWLLDNEAKAGAFGEFFFHRDAPAALAYLSIATGIGSGLVTQGQQPGVLRGVQGLGGEIGHTVLQPGGKLCHCGNRGCAETLVSGWAIRAALGVPEGIRLSDALNTRLHDVDVQLTLQRAGEALGMLLLNIHHTFNPAEIVIGGSLTRLGDPLLQPALAYFNANQSRLLAGGQHVPVRVAPDSTFIPARGAAAQVLASAIHSTGIHA